MPIRFPRLLPIALLSFSVAAPAAAEGLAPPPDAFLKGLSRAEMRAIGTDKARALTRYYGMALELAPDGVVTSETILMRQKLQAASQRGMRLGSFLGHDLDGDMTISAEEFRVQAGALKGFALSRLLVLRETADKNGDGAVDLAEMKAAAKTAAPSVYSSYLDRRYDILLKMDVNGDGQTTLAEITQVVTRVTAKLREEGGRINPIGRPRIAVPPTKL